MQFQIKKDRVSLDITGGVLTLDFKGFHLPITMNKSVSLDIIDSKVCLSYDGNTYHLDFSSLENVFYTPPSGSKHLISIPVAQPVVQVQPVHPTPKEGKRPNHIRYDFHSKRLPPLTSKVLSVCLTQNLSRKEIFQKILDAKEYSNFLSLDKHRRSYDYYRTLWTLEKEGFLYCDFQGGRHAKNHKFQTTAKGKEFLKSK